MGIFISSPLLRPPALQTVGTGQCYRTGAAVPADILCFDSPSCPGDEEKDCATRCSLPGRKREQASSSYCSWSSLFCTTQESVAALLALLERRTSGLSPSRPGATSLSARPTTSRTSVFLRCALANRVIIISADHHAQSVRASSAHARRRTTQKQAGLRPSVAPGLQDDGLHVFKVSIG